MDIATSIDGLLPQTQCRRCGFDGCRPYAESLAAGSAALNRCPPGGEILIARLAGLLGRAALPPDPHCGGGGPPTVALIDEVACIGCARCLTDCPTDAILGARRYLHVVVAADCSGCELCLPSCPVDCIRMVPAADAGSQSLDWEEIQDRARRFRRRHEARQARRARDAGERRRSLDASLAEPA